MYYPSRFHTSNFVANAGDRVITQRPATTAAMIEGGYNPFGGGPVAGAGWGNEEDEDFGGNALLKALSGLSGRRR